VDPLLASLRVKAGDVYGQLEPTIGPAVNAAKAALGRLVDNSRTLATEAGLKLQSVSRDIPVGGGSTLHDLLFGDQQAQVLDLDFNMYWMPTPPPPPTYIRYRFFSSNN
jgi:hypothetical protein